LNYKSKQRASSQRLAADPAVSSSRAEKVPASWADPVVSEARAAGIKKAWEDPSYRGGQSSRMRGNTYGTGYRHTEEAVEKIRAAARAQWAARRENV
jgi:hypothetical protein